MPDRAAARIDLTVYAREMRTSWIVVATLAMPAVAAADSLPGALALEGWYGKLGLETGVAFGRDRGAAALVGGVATVVKITDELDWYGLSADLLVDGNGDADAGARWSAGPQLGRSIFGMEAGYFGERLGLDGAGPTTRHGLQVRAKLTVGVAALYLRGTYTPRQDESSVELGMQVKAPVWMRRSPRAVRSRP